jgi:hypothetical protein
MGGYKTLASDYPVHKEMGDWGTDPDSGSLVRKLTSPQVWSHNIYCEQPYASPDGKRVMIVRAADSFCATRQFVIAQLEGGWHLTLVEGEVYESFGHSPWAEWAYYQVADGALRRISLVTLERQEVLPATEMYPPGKGWVTSISVDNRYLMIDEQMPEGKGTVTYGLDLMTMKKHVLAEGKHNPNPHSQFDRRPGGPFALRQYFAPDGRSTIQVMGDDMATGKSVQFPIGGDWCAESSGHMAWVGLSGKVACALGWDAAGRKHDPRHPEGNVAICAAGDAKPRIYRMPEHAFYHVSVSKCGKYMVGDDFMDFKADGFVARGPGPCRIVVANIETGKYRVLIKDCQNYGIAGSSRYEPDPYMTADNKYVIYNASPFGTMQVFAAQVPDGFLKSLD